MKRIEGWWGGREAGTVPRIDKSRLMTSQDDCPHGSSDSPLLRPYMWSSLTQHLGSKQGHHCEAQEGRLSVPWRHPAAVESSLLPVLWLVGCLPPRPHPGLTSA